MRISDWSSDVCSSDLPEHGRLAGTRKAGDEQQTGRGGGVHAAGASRSSASRILIGADASKAERWSAGSGWPAIVSTRSEEHTSELQSLMRISYAVFCLKKKNKLINAQKKTKRRTRKGRQTTK